MKRNAFRPVLILFLAGLLFLLPQAAVALAEDPGNGPVGTTEEQGEKTPAPEDEIAIIPVYTCGHGDTIYVGVTDESVSTYDCIRSYYKWPFQEEDDVVMDDGEVLLGFSRQPVTDPSSWDEIFSALIDPDTPVSTIILEDIDLYLVWAKPVEQIELTVAPPEAGTETDTAVAGTDEDGNALFDWSTQTNRPAVQAAGTGYHLRTDGNGDCAYWTDYRWPYCGTLEAGETYSFSIELEADPGYVFLPQGMRGTVIQGGTLLEAWRNGLVFDVSIAADTAGHVEGHLTLPDAPAEEPAEEPEDEEPAEEGPVDEGPASEEEAPAAEPASPAEEAAPNTGDPIDTLPFLLLFSAGFLAALLAGTKHRKQQH